MESRYQDLYTGEKYLARGNFGSVYLVNRIDDPSKLFVSKKIDQINKEENERNKDMIEINLLRNLNHPHVVNYQQHFQETDLLIIILEYCDSGDLSQLIKKHQKENTSFTEAEVMVLCTHMCFALKHVHSKRIIHRDMKPQNILISGKDYKLADFGISIENDLAMTQIGTPYYLSPELVNKQAYGPKTDVWGLGCILYELCALQKAFDGSNIFKICNLICEKEPKEIKGNYSEDLIKLINKLLIKDQQLRPSIDEILQMPYVQGFIAQPEKKKEEIKDEQDQKFDKQDQKFDDIDLSEHINNPEFPHRKKCFNQEKCQFWRKINDKQPIAGEEGQFILIHLIQFDHIEVKCLNFKNCQLHREYANNLNCDINIQLHEAFYLHPPIEQKLIIQDQNEFDTFKNQERIDELIPTSFSIDICQIFHLIQSNYDSDLRYINCYNYFKNDKTDYDELDFLSLLKEELEQSEIWKQFLIQYNIDFDKLEAIANEKFHDKRHKEMRSPCSIPELIAIILSLQSPFLENIRQIDMKFIDPKEPDSLSDQYQQFRDTFHQNHELTVMKYLSLSGLLKIAMSDPQKKPSKLFLPFSTIQVDEKNLQIAENYDFLLESLSICTDDVRIAKQQLGNNQKGTILEINVASTKFRVENKELPLTFFVASVDWLMRNYKERQFIIFGEFGWKVDSNLQSQNNENGIQFHQISDLIFE